MRWYRTEPALAVPARSLSLTPWGRTPPSLWPSHRVYQYLFPVATAAPSKRVARWVKIHFDDPSFRRRSSLLCSRYVDRERPSMPLRLRAGYCGSQIARTL